MVAGDAVVGRSVGCDHGYGGSWTHHCLNPGLGLDEQYPGAWDVREAYHP